MLSCCSSASVTASSKVGLTRLQALDCLVD